MLRALGEIWCLFCDLGAEREGNESLNGERELDGHVEWRKMEVAPI